MCARYNTTDLDLDVFADYRLTWASPRLSETRHEMFPGYLGPVIRLREDEAGLDAMRWGLIPFWAKPPDPGKFRHTFNARAETIDTLPSFRAAFQRRRCLVPAACFVEFPTVEGRKVMHRVHATDGAPLMFAGIWERCEAANEEILSYTIITAEPNEDLRWLHHRMPVALPREAQRAWMDPDTPAAEAKALLACPAREFLTAAPA